MKTLRFSLLIALAASPALLFAGNEFITYSATAASGYLRPAGANGAGRRAETYVFSPGKFFGNGTRDHGLEATNFNKIAQILAPNLAKQDYFPTKDVKGADLVIIVHWGATQVYEDPNRIDTVANLGAAAAGYQADFAANGMLADPSALNAAIMNDEQDDILRSRYESENAALLGYKGELTKTRKDMFMSAGERTLRYDLQDERYFVVLMAYDNRSVQVEHKPKLLWVTRLSVRSNGNNFQEALPALSQTGAEIFGKQIDGLVRVRRSMGAPTVKLGELEVVGEGDAAKKPETPAK